MFSLVTAIILLRYGRTIFLHAWPDCSYVRFHNFSLSSFLLKEQGVDISKLALHFTLEMEDIPTTLVSTASIQNLQKNIDAVSEKLTDAERDCMQYIVDK